MASRTGNVTAELVVNNFPRIRANFPVVVNQIMSKATHDVYAKSQVTVPVRKDQRKVRGGFLKNSGQVTYDSGSMEGEVTYTAYYAVYVHEGTRRMPARPFLTNALKDVQPGMQAAFSSLESRLL